jgi:hypothetical protein
MVHLAIIFQVIDNMAAMDILVMGIVVTAIVVTIDNND